MSYITQASELQLSKFSEPEITDRLEKSMYAVAELASIEIEILKTYVPQMGLICASILNNHD